MGRLHDVRERSDAFDFLVFRNFDVEIGLRQIVADFDGRAVGEEAEEGSDVLDVGLQRGVEEGFAAGCVVKELRSDDEEMEAERNGRQKLASHFGKERVGDAEGLIEAKQHRERVEASQRAGVARPDHVELPNVLADLLLVFLLDVMGILRVLAVHHHHHQHDGEAKEQAGE